MRVSWDLSAESISFDLRANEIEAPEPWSVELQRHTWKRGIQLHPKLLTGICPGGRNMGERVPLCQFRYVTTAGATERVTWVLMGESGGALTSSRHILPPSDCFPYHFSHRLVTRVLETGLQASGSQ